MSKPSVPTPRTVAPLVLHYDGERWQRLVTGASGDLWWISVTPIDGSFYMAGALSPALDKLRLDVTEFPLRWRA
jgi:hypothetical protein